MEGRAPSDAAAAAASGGAELLVQNLAVTRTYPDVLGEPMTIWPGLGPWASLSRILSRVFARFILRGCLRYLATWA